MEKYLLNIYIGKSSTLEGNKKKKQKKNAINRTVKIDRQSVRSVYFFDVIYSIYFFRLETLNSFSKYLFTRITCLSMMHFCTKTTILAMFYFTLRNLKLVKPVESGHLLGCRKVTTHYSQCLLSRYCLKK